MVQQQLLQLQVSTLAIMDMVVVVSSVELVVVGVNEQ